MKDHRVSGGLRDNVGSLFQSAIEKLGTVGDAVVKTSRAGRVRLDVALLERKRAKLYAEIGELVGSLVAAGRLEVPASVHERLDRIEGLDERIRSDRATASGGLGVEYGDGGPDEEPAIARPTPVRRAAGTARAARPAGFSKIEDERDPYEPSEDDDE